MDVPLYALALVLFAVLYLAIGVFLAYTLIITLFFMFAYLSIRYGKMPDNYPNGLGDTLITVAFIGVTWGIFTFLAPKNPIPFVGDGLTYTTGSTVPVSALLTIGIVLAFMFLGILAFIARDLHEAGAGTGGGGGVVDPTAKPKQGVGA
ncbi:MAG: hypothetical protein L3K19_08590 [Thermoplasmata archaeon]|nr:hypothetical protein [Thermoplasmata archaeon]